MDRTAKTMMLLTALVLVPMSGCGGPDPQPSDIASQDEQEQELNLRRHRCCILRFSGEGVLCGDIKATKVGAQLSCEGARVWKGANSADVRDGRCSEQAACGGAPPIDDGDDDPGDGTPPSGRTCNSSERCCEPAISGGGCLLCVARERDCP